MGTAFQRFGKSSENEADPYLYQDWVLGVDPILLLLYILRLLLLYYIVLCGYYFDCILVPFGPPNFCFLTVYMSYICIEVVVNL